MPIMNDYVTQKYRAGPHRQQCYACRERLNSDDDVGDRTPRSAVALSVSLDTPSLRARYSSEVYPARQDVCGYAACTPREIRESTVLPSVQTGGSTILTG